MKTMKLMLLAATVMFGTALFANVQNSVNADNTGVTVVQTQTTDDEFVNVKFDELNEKVQATIQSFTELYEVKGLEYNAAKKLTRVTLTAKTDQTSKVVLLDDEGKEYVEPVEAATE